MTQAVAWSLAAVRDGTTGGVPAAAMTGLLPCQSAPSLRLPTVLARLASEGREIGHAFPHGMGLAYRNAEGAGWEAQADGAGNAEIETRKRKRK